jgi:hypothetical protein
MPYVYLSAVFFVLCLGFSNAHAGGEMKKVCRQEKGKEVCRTVKVHKKLEGTAVPK